MRSLQEGFTYIWLLLTVALMGVGLVMATEVQTTASQRDRETELLAIGQQFRYALASYYQARLPNNPVGTGGAVVPAAIPFGQAVSGAPPAAGGGAAAFAVPGGVLAANPTAMALAAAAAANAAASGVGTGSALPPQVDPLGYPATLDELLKDNRFPGLRRHLRKVFVDPMTGKAEWGLIQVSGRIVGIHSLSTAVPIKQAGFDDESQTFTGAQSYTDWVFGFASQMPLPGSVTGVGGGGTAANLPPAAGLRSPTQQQLFGDPNNAAKKR